MPQIVSFDKMDVGKKGKGKHWTKKQVEKRKNAAQKFNRNNQKKLQMPVWLDDNARSIWKKTIKNMAGLDILDVIDEDALAIYCDAVAKYIESTLKIREQGFVTENFQGTESINPYVKAAQSYARIMMQYADKLGLNPNSRARLAKKIADEEVDPNADLFD